MAVLILVALALLFFTLPFIVKWKLLRPRHLEPLFPIGIDPQGKTIVENPEADAFFNDEENPIKSILADANDAFDIAAVAIASSPLYRFFPLPEVYLVRIQPGYRKEEVAAAFGDAFGWDALREQKFLESNTAFGPRIAEGEFAPGVYLYDKESGNKTIRESIRNQFETEILSRFSSASAARVSLDEALKIASIIQRETGNKRQMRIISGIIWNRLFRGMNLQMDATLQYAKATKETGWWPPVYPADKYIDSPYNTYKNAGLPPAPIANPGVAALIATLNPKKTPCLFYLHDRWGGFHCSTNYNDHVALIKKYYRKR